MKAIYALVVLSSIAALANAGYIGHSSYGVQSGRAGEISFVVALLNLIGEQFGLNSVGRNGHLTNEEVAAIVASLHANGHHGQSHRGLSNADTAAIVASLYAGGHGHQTHSAGLSHDIIPAVVAGLYANGYGHSTHQVSSHTADTVKVATSSHSSGSHSSHSSGSHSSHSTGGHTGHSTGGGYSYRGHKK